MEAKRRLQLAEMRSLHNEYEGIGKYLIDLLHEQQEAQRALSPYLPENQRDCCLPTRKPVQIRKMGRNSCPAHNVLTATPNHIKCSSNDTAKCMMSVMKTEPYMF
jgi:hypothetical protein